PVDGCYGRIMIAKANDSFLPAVPLMLGRRSVRYCLWDSWIFFSDRVNVRAAAQKGRASRRGRLDALIPRARFSILACAVTQKARAFAESLPSAMEIFYPSHRSLSA